MVPEVESPQSKVEGTDPEKTALLPLDAPERIAVFRMKGKSYRHVFRRVTPKDRITAAVSIEIR